MPDPEDPKPMFDPEGDERGYEGAPQEEGPTPGSAEGEDEDLPHPSHPYEPPDKTPGNAEG